MRSAGDRPLSWHLATVEGCSVTSGDMTSLEGRDQHVYVRARSQGAVDTAADKLKTAKRMGADEGLLSGDGAATRIKHNNHLESGPPQSRAGFGGKALLTSVRTDSAYPPSCAICATRARPPGPSNPRRPQSAPW